jgi:hypothetical protein
MPFRLTYYLWLMVLAASVVRCLRGDSLMLLLYSIACTMFLFVLARRVARHEGETNDRKPPAGADDVVPPPVG